MPDTIKFWIGGAMATMTGLVGYIFRCQDRRIEQVEEACVDRVYDKERHASIKDRLDKGDERFLRIEKKMDDQTVMISGIGESVAILLDRSDREMKLRNGSEE